MARGNSRKGGDKTPAGMKLSEFEKEKSPQPRPVYVLVGADPYLLDQGRRRVRKIVLGDADPGLALLEAIGAEAVLADVLDALRTPGMLAPRRLVEIREAEGFLKEGAGAGENVRNGENPREANVREALLKYFEAPSPTGTLVLEVASWNSNLRLARRIAEIGLVILCQTSDVSAIPRWLQKQSKDRYKKTISYAATQMLLEYLGDNYASLLSALDVLALHAGDSETLDTPDVDALVARGHHERVWDFCDAVAARQVPRAMELLDAFWADGMVAPQVVGLLRNTFRQLLRAKALARRLGLDAAMDKAGVWWQARDRVRRALAAFSDDQLADAYQALVDADLEAKSSPSDRLAMETLLHRLCMAEAARSFGGRSQE